MSPNNERYSYSPLEEDTIRVIQFLPNSNPQNIRCFTINLPEYHTDQAALYTALSYCWGNAKSTREITLDGNPFTVTTNLWEALIALHSYDSSARYWVDAICINQMDLDERNSQVRQMWRIFASAQSVISWLGPKDNDTDCVFNAFEYHDLLVSRTNDTLFFPTADYERVGVGVLPTTAPPDSWGRALRDLCCREYFERAWIIPEVLQSRHAIVLCGDRRTSWTTFESLVLLAQKSWAVDKTFPATITKSPGVLQAVKICEVRRMLRASIEFTDPFEVFYDVLEFYVPSRCSDERDHIFAFLGDPRIRRLRLLDSMRADYLRTPEQISLIVMEQFSQFIKQGDGIPGERYDRALLLITEALKVNLSSQAYYDWFQPQVSRVHEIARTPAGNAVYLIELKSGSAIYLDRYQLRKLRKDPLFASIITSPADKWDGYVGLEEIGDHQTVIPLRNLRKRDDSALVVIG